jgi:hypothetical protein
VVRSIARRELIVLAGRAAVAAALASGPLDLARPCSARASTPLRRYGTDEKYGERLG